jgi:Ca2+-binding RTX toxin-like protein
LAVFASARGQREYGRRRGGRIALAAVCIACAVPAVASGSTASISIKRIFYAAAPGEVNQLTISAAGSDYALSDPGATIQPGAGCTGGAQNVVCAGAGIIGFTVSGGDGGDDLRNTTSKPATLSGGDGADSLEGGPANDTLRGNQGIDTVSGGDGDDFIDVRGDRAGIVSCGLGDDEVRGDGSDLIGSDCEHVDRGGAPPPAPATPGSSPPPTPAAGGMLGPTETKQLAPGACANDMLGTPAPDLLEGTRRATTSSGSRGTIASAAAHPTTASSGASVPTSSRAPPGTTICSATTRAAAFPAATT